MTSFISMLDTQTEMLLYMAVGFLCWKKRIISKGSLQNFIDFLMSIALPAMVFNSFNQPLTIDVLKKSAVALALAIFAAGVGVLCGKCLYKKYPKDIRAVMQYGSVVNACTFSGLPLVEALYGAQGMIFASIYILPNRILMWTLGPMYFSKKEASAKGLALRMVKNPNILAVIFGLLRSALGVQLPVVVNTAIKGLAGIASPFSLVIVGAILAQADFQKLFCKGVGPLCMVRLILIPLSVLLAATVLSVDPLIRGIAVILSAMPIGATTALFSAKYGADARFASSCVFVTTVFSLVTATIFILFI